MTEKTILCDYNSHKVKIVQDKEGDVIMRVFEDDEFIGLIAGSDIRDFIVKEQKRLNRKYRKKK